MIIYVTREYEPQGGFYSGSIENTPSLFAEEIRRVDDFPDDEWKLLNEGTWIVPGPDGTFDDYWFPYFDSGKTMWRR